MNDLLPTHVEDLNPPPDVLLEVKELQNSRLSVREFLKQSSFNQWCIAEMLGYHRYYLSHTTCDHSRKKRAIALLLDRLLRIEEMDPQRIRWPWRRKNLAKGSFMDDRFHVDQILEELFPQLPSLREAEKQAANKLIIKGRTGRVWVGFGGEG